MEIMIKFKEDMDQVIEVYTTTAFVCPWCEKLKDLLRIYGYDFIEYDISQEPEKTFFSAMGFKKIPQVFINDHHIGGYETTKDYLRNNFFSDHPDKDQILQELKELE